MRLLRSGIVRNALALYGVQICRKVLPFVSIPYLARILGPTAWGRVAFVQAFSEMLVLLIEFGFTLSATREIARSRDSREDCADIMAGVLGAQGVLALVALLAAAAAYLLTPELQADSRLVPAGILYALAQGFAPLWFFQGIERMTVAALLEVVGKVLGLVGIFLFIHSPADDWKVLALQAWAPTLSTVLGLVIAYRYIPIRIPSPGWSSQRSRQAGRCSCSAAASAFTALPMRSRWACLHRLPKSAITLLQKSSPRQLTAC